MIEGGGGNPAAILIGVVGSTKSEGGEGAVDGVAFNSATEDELVAASGVVRTAVGAGFERAAKFGESEGRDIVSDAQFLGGLIKGRHALADGGEQLHLLSQLIAVSVEATLRAEENLTVDAESGPGGNDLSDLLQLLREVIFAVPAAEGGRYTALSIAAIVARRKIRAS